MKIAFWTMFWVWNIVAMVFISYSGVILGYPSAVWLWRDVLGVTL